MKEPALDPRFEYDYEGRMVWRRTVPSQFFVAMGSAVAGVLWFLTAGRAGIDGLPFFIGTLGFPTLSAVSLFWGVVRLLAWPKRYKGWALALFASILTAANTALSMLTIDFLMHFHGPS